MSTSRMPFGTPNKLNQSTDNVYMQSHLFPSPYSSQSLRDQEDTYLQRNPQRVTAVSSTPQSVQNQTPKQNDNEAKYFITPYKTPTPATPREKSPASDLPPTRSVYQVIKEKQTASIPDTTMMDRELSPERGRDAYERPDPQGGIDWEYEAQVRGGPFAQSGPYAGALVTQGPFAGVDSQRAYYQAPAYTPTRPQFGPQSPPFARTFPVEEERPQAESIWVTVFGFPPNQAASNFVLQQFQSMGDVVEYSQPVGTNWFHLRYMLRAHVDRALAKNGKLIGEHMIGVVLRPVDNAGRDLLPSTQNTITNKEANRTNEREASLLPPKDQSWLKSVISFTFG